MQRSDFHYELPSSFIARYPTERRTDSRLLVLKRPGDIVHAQFKQLLEYLNPGDVLVFNNSKVMKARLFGNKATGGKVEILVERIVEEKNAWVHIKSSRSPKPGAEIIFADNIRAVVSERNDALFLLAFDIAESLLTLLEQYGELPLPPYMLRSAEQMDENRYQTVFAKHLGSVAAPTASLHFDDEFLQQIQEKGIKIAYLTLHVGAGTFLPVRVDKLDQHKMHAEYLTVSEETCHVIEQAKNSGGRVVAVGTTVTRSLETAAASGQLKPFSGESQLFIYPGYSFKVVDLLLTNFHLPESTLLMLVCALGGYEKVMNAYKEAIAKQYRFYSYGDAMLVGVND